MGYPNPRGKDFLPELPNRQALKEKKPQKQMKIGGILSKLKSSQAYKKFIEKFPDTHFYAAFIIFEKNKEPQVQLDFYLPSQEKIASFEEPFEKFTIHEDKISPQKKQSEKINPEIDEVWKSAEILIKNRSPNFKLSKIIAVLSNGTWSLTCIDGFLGIIKIKINSEDGKEKSFEKSSILNYLKKS